MTTCLICLTCKGIPILDNIFKFSFPLSLFLYYTAISNKTRKMSQFCNSHIESCFTFAFSLSFVLLTLISSLLICMPEQRSIGSLSSATFSTSLALFYRSRSRIRLPFSKLSPPPFALMWLLLSLFSTSLVLRIGKSWWSTKWLPKKKPCTLLNHAVYWSFKP